MKNNFITTVLLTLVASSCGGPVNIEGDVYLVKGDGKPQPAAAKQVYFIPSESKSLEDILIDSYVSSIAEEAQRNGEAISKLCLTSATAIKPEIEKETANLIQVIKLAKSDGTTDADGSCSLLNINLVESIKSAESSQEKYKNLLSIETSKIDEATKKRDSLSSTLSIKIRNKEKELYDNFIRDIKITIDNRGGLTLINNTEFNIKMTNDMCFQFKNAIGEEVGVVDDGIFTRCGNSTMDMYSGKGTRLSSFSVNKSSKDEFGFSKGGFLPKGSEINNPYGRNNRFCPTEYTPAQLNKFTQTYGENKRDWPDTQFPVNESGYIMREPKDATYSGDKNACLIKGAVGRFVPLEDEIRLEKSDGTVTYSSKEISFGAIAASEYYPERDLIKEQQNIIETARKEKSALSLLSKNDAFIVIQNKAQKEDQICKAHQKDIKLYKNTIDILNSNLIMSESCDLSDSYLLPSLQLTDSVDIALTKSLMNVDYSINASEKFMSIFTDALYKTSSNISGHFVMKELPRGEYLMVSSYSDNFNEGIFIAKEVIEADAIIDLSNSNFFEIPSLNYLASSFYENCNSALCSDEDLKNSLDLSFIASEAVRVQKENEEALRDLQALCRSMGIDC